MATRTSGSTIATPHDAHRARHHAHKGQQHPIRLYLVVWGLLFVLSTFSYLVDYFGLQGYLRWSLIILFMMLKAGLIVAVFMHMAWERLALAYAILLPPVLMLVFVAMMVIESDYTHLLRGSCSSPHRRRNAYHCFGQEENGYDNLRHAYANWTEQGILKVKDAPRRLDAAKKALKKISAARSNPSTSPWGTMTWS